MLLKRFILSFLLVSILWLGLENVTNQCNGFVFKSEKSNHFVGVKYVSNQNVFSKVIISEELGDFGDNLFQNLENHTDGQVFETYLNKLLQLVQNKALRIPVFYLTNHKIVHLFILFHSWKYLSF